MLFSMDARNDGTHPQSNVVLYIGLRAEHGDPDFVGIADYLRSLDPRDERLAVIDGPDNTIGHSTWVREARQRRIIDPRVWVDEYVDAIRTPTA